MNLEDVTNQTKETGLQNNDNEPEKIVASILESVERTFSEHDFVSATEAQTSTILSDNSLFCRSESLSSVIHMLEEESKLAIQGNNGTANMCAMRGGEGFRVAMSEGFSKEEHDKFVKVVITFRDEHLSSNHQIASDSSLWEFKSHTAENSRSGDGDILLSDIEMISVRYPTRYFPEDSYTEKESDLLEKIHVKFIVRHYIPKIKTTSH